MPASFWDSFEQDPRSPANAGLRASDADREVMHRLLGEAFADGRLDRDEHDRRSSAALTARTLGDLPPLVADLVREPATPARVTDDLRAVAERRYAAELRNAWGTFVTASLVTWVIWAVVSGWGSFPWPAIVSAATFAGVVRTRINRQDIVDRQERKLRRREQEARGLPDGRGDGGDGDERRA